MAKTVKENLSFFAALSSRFPGFESLTPVDQEKAAAFIHSYINEASYQLVWPGKTVMQNIITETPITKLVAHHGSSINWHGSENLLIEGENLEVLKILRDNYANRIHAIYIDPPYNTGKKHFVFQDHFSPRTSSKMHSGIKAGTANSIQSLQHAPWLSFMYPRLYVARQLLKDEGIIFISIDENELANLKLIMDEIFGQQNFVEIFCWAKSETPANLSKKSKKVVEYILCYQRKKNSDKFKGVKKKVISSNGLLNQSNKVNILKFPPGVVRTKIEDGKLSKGLYGTDKYQIVLLEDTEVAGGVFVKPVVLSAKFKWTQPKLDRELKTGVLINIPTDKLSPSYERKEYEAEVPPNLINAKVGVATNETAGQELKELLGAKVFDFPKPPSLIKYLLNFYDDPNGIILDFFAGSGSTAQAVLEMNKFDSGSRKFICIQIAEPTPEKSIARQNGFATISEITKQRIEKVLQRLAAKGTMEGFRYYATELI